MLFYVYILESEGDGTLYIGITEDLKRRYVEHLAGTGCRTTSMKTDWKFIYFEGYPDKRDALGREKFLKSGLVESISAGSS
ncbi:MAG: GIY-YIG nuclease family protein [Candidatus Moranbacteria bacterium]|nr:GIY-YIG nuclease family protein [Candidatus Moranbacteria bacterium]